MVNRNAKKSANDGQRAGTRFLYAMYGIVEWVILGAVERVLCIPIILIIIDL